MRPSLRIGAVALAAICLSACHHLNPFKRFATSVDCHRAQEYQRARQLEPLKVPPGLDTPNTQGALVIPSLDLAPPPPGPKEPCLDVPPKYKAAPPPKGLSG